ncbi:carbohydrate ABC transporter permease [Murimonas intestini]|uniref:Aldouronate transport system permease protein n=1 Tax=Murimonas intestini TaxID=1337051 RepID=A0AB73T174_9FIRM|nr:carbohydrate ABC transporter permease [Murimonas intestini]MCR1840132.1 carbohydrate ABC transporter permease [Murimonas intestini]MCR1867584.1 carbohydrate ABC transporter permease [Murimonas intestini]MCR1885001.1 carbohydrate ABC transporter permease [Murimonas intestini]
MKSREYRVTQLLAHLVCGLFALMALLPFILLIVASFTDNGWATANGFSFFPKEWSLDAYRYIAVQWDTIGRAYVMTIVVTLVGTASSILVTTLFAYAICQKDVPGMKVLSFMLIFTMLFNGGLVATYYTYVNYFHVRNTIWALILPNLMMNAFNVILVRNYFVNSIPYSLIEAARLDGASEFGIFFKVVMPLSLPIIATIGLMTGLMYWNDWQNGMYYLTERGGGHLYTIQIILNNINENINALLQNSSATGGMNIKMPSTTVRMAIATVGILPILVIYPFFQKYFVKGITLGGVKE